MSGEKVDRPLAAPPRCARALLRGFFHVVLQLSRRLLSLAGFVLYYHLVLRSLSATVFCHGVSFSP